jgi:hypothetical protein
MCDIGRELREVEFEPLGECVPADVADVVEDGETLVEREDRAPVPR